MVSAAGSLVTQEMPFLATPQAAMVAIGYNKMIAASF